MLCTRLAATLYIKGFRQRNTFFCLFWRSWLEWRALSDVRWRRGGKNSNRLSLSCNSVPAAQRLKSAVTRICRVRQCDG